MKNSFTITPTLRATKHYQKTDGTFPIKLNVFDKRTKKRRYYGIDVSLTEQEYDWIMNEPKGNKATSEYKSKKKVIDKLRERINDETKRAVEIADSLKVFTLNGFAEAYLQKDTAILLTVKEYFDLVMAEKKESGDIGTATSYGQTWKRITEFQLFKKRKTDLLFDEIDKKWLDSFEKWYCFQSDKDRTKSGSSVGIYVRNLKAVYNLAIKKKVVPVELYPFYTLQNKDGYKAPRTKKTNRGLSEEFVSLLFNAQPRTQQQQIAKDFWFFSYLSNGMNLKDIALLRFKDIKDEQFEFIRAKTEKTRKDDLTRIQIPILDYHLEMFATYGNKKVNENDFVFDIIRRTDNPEQRYRKVINFLRLINQHIKILAKNNGITTDISYQWARHTNTQIKLKNGVSAMRISQGLGHTKLSTTTAYIGNQSTEENKKTSDMLMDKLKTNNKKIL